MGGMALWMQFPGLKIVSAGLWCSSMDIVTCADSALVRSCSAQNKFALGDLPKSFRTNHLMKICWNIDIIVHNNVIELYRRIHFSTTSKIQYSWMETIIFSLKYTKMQIGKHFMLRKPVQQVMPITFSSEIATSIWCVATEIEV